MAIRTVAQAAAEIRLSDTKANQDFEKIRRDLIAKATRLEADMAVSIAVTVDQNSLRSVANGLSRLQQSLPSLVVPITANTDKVLADIIALTTLDLVVEVPVTANIEPAQSEIGGLQGADTVIELPVTVNAEQALREIIALTEIDAVIRIPVVVDRPAAAEIPVSKFPTGPTSFSLQADVADARSQIDSFIAALPPVVLRVLVDTDEFLTGVTTVAEAVPPVTVAVLADTDAVPAAVEKIDLPPLEVPVTAATVGPGIAVSPGLARFRAEMAALEQEGVLVRVLGDTTNAEAKIDALGGGDPPDPIVIPVAVDTDQAQAELAAVDAVARPVSVPVVVDAQQFLADLRRISGAALNLPPVVIPTVLGPPPPPPTPPKIPPVVLPVTANTVPAQQQVRAFGSDVERESQTHGDRAGSAFGRGFSAAATGVMATAAITLGGVLASSLIEGFQRFTTIQDSTESLTVALQSASEAAEVLGNVLNVVRGTPFRLDDFARAATNMISFGIAADKVPLFLTAIGEAAATRGSQANQFAQSLSTIYGQIQAIGRINGEDVWQFGNVGVDVLRILGNTMDKTTEEVRKMISEGAVTSEFALDAITQGILNGTDGINGATVAFSGTMERLGDTLSGSIENFGAARARFGVAIIRPLSDTMIAGFKSFTAVIDDFSARVEPLFKGLAESPLIEGLNDFFENAPSLIQPTIDALEELGPALAPIGIAIGALGLGALGSVLGPFGALIPGITSLTGALTVFGASAALLSPEIREALIPALKELGDVGLAIGGTLVEGIGEGIEGVAPTVVRALDVLADIGPEIETLFTQAFGAIGELGPKIVPILDNIVILAQQALPVAFRAASQGIAVLTGVVDAALPIVNKLVEAATDLVPTFDAMLDVTAQVGEVLIPVLSTVGDVIGQIPVGVLQTLLGVFLGFKAVQFVGGVFDSIQVSAKKASTSVGDFTRNVAVGMPVASKAAVAAGTAVSGAFAGMALASEDSSTRMIGALGAIGTVLTGFALGGAPGGIFAGVGVALGFISQGMIDAKRETEALELAVGQLADRIRSEFSEELVTPEGIINTEAFQDIVVEGLGADALATLRDELDVGFEDIQDAAQTQAELVQRAIEMGMDPTEITFFKNWVNEQIGELVRLRAAVDGFDFSEALARRIGTMSFDNLNDSEFIDFSKRLAREFGLDSEDVRAQMRATEDVQEELGDSFGTTVTQITGGISEVLVLQDALGVSAEETGDKQEDAAYDAGQAAEDYRKLLMEEGVTYEELQAQAKLLGDENVDAADRASEAWERFGNVLDAVKTKMDLTVQTQNLDQDMRDLGDTLDEVVNTEDIKKADQIGEDILNAEKRIAELKGRLADETVEGDIIRADLDRRIAFAESRGFEETVAALQAQRDLSFEDAQEVQRDIDEQMGEIAEMRGELDGLVTTPITMFQVLTEQAAQANMSMFEFLLAAPTEESQQVFQDGMVGTVSSAIAQAKTVGEVEGALAGQAAAESFRADFAANLTTQFGPETAAQLIENLWPQTLLAAGAQEAANVAVEEFNKQVEADLAAEPGTIDLNAEILDLTQQRNELDTFIKDHPGIEVPISLAEFDEAIVDLRVKKVNETIDARIAEIELADQVQLAESNRRGGTVGEAFATMFPNETELAKRAAAQLLKDAQDALNESDPVEMKAQIVEVEKTRDEFQEMIAERDIELPANLNIESINLVIDEANRAAILDEFKSVMPAIFGGNVELDPGEVAQQAITNAFLKKSGVPDFLLPKSGAYAEGGIHGFGTMDAPHTAQIATGYRLWAEPETGGEAYIPLGMGKRVGALGVFMKVAEILDMEVRPRKEVPTLVDVHVPEIRIPEVARMFHAADTRGQTADIATAVRNAMVDAMHAVRRPVTQDDLERNVVVERIEKLVIGEGETPRKRASEFIREMRLRAARL